MSETIADLLPHPWNPLYLRHSRTIRLRVNSYLDGAIEIHPRGATEPVRKPTLRLFAVRLDRPEAQSYWDVNAAQIREALLHYFEAGATLPVDITIAAHGYAGRRVFSLDIGGSSDAKAPRDITST